MEKLNNNSPACFNPKITDILHRIVLFYQSTRGIGHTTLMKKGLLDYTGDNPPFVVVTSHMHAKSLNIKRFLELQDYAGWYLRVPLAWDNFTIQMLASESLKEINRLEAKIKDLEQALEAQKSS